MPTSYTHKQYVSGPNVTKPGIWGAQSCDIECLLPHDPTITANWPSPYCAVFYKIPNGAKNIHFLVKNVEKGIPIWCFHTDGTMLTGTALSYHCRSGYRYYTPYIDPECWNLPLYNNNIHQIGPLRDDDIPGILFEDETANGVELTPLLSTNCGIWNLITWQSTGLHSLHWLGWFDPVQLMSNNILSFHPNQSMRKIPPGGSGEPNQYYKEWVAYLKTNFSTDYTEGLRVCLTQALQVAFPSIFDSNFKIDDSRVNGTGQPLFRVDSTSYHTITIDNEVIQWTGESSGGYGDTHWKDAPQPNLADGTHWSNELRIDESHHTLIIGMIPDISWGYLAEWDEPDDPDDDPPLPPPPTPDPPPDPPTPEPPEPPTPPDPDPIVINTEPPAYPNQIRYTNLEEVTLVRRGDDIVIPQPYAGIAVFRDGKYIVAGREKGRLVLVGPDDLVISSGDPFSLRHDYDKLICYGIAMHVSEESLYLLVGEEGSTDLYITRIEIIGRTSGCSAKCNCGENCNCSNPQGVPSDAKLFNGYYYKVYKESLTWEEAKTKCEDLGGHLCVITSQEENDFVKGLVSEAIGTPSGKWDGAWIGCYGQSPQWYWLDGSKVGYTSWYPGQPDYVGAGPVYNGVIMVSGLWHDSSAGGKYPRFVCEWPVVDPGSPRFKWNPAFDIKLPSMTAKNIDYNDFQPIYWGVGYERGGYSPNGLQWITHLLRKKQPDVINDWSKLHDDLAVNLTQFPMIGPILPEYKPCITGVGARVMVSVVNVQVYQCSFDMKVWYENTASKDEPWKWRNSPSSVRAMWSETLRSILKKRNLIDETLQQTTLDGPGIRTPPVLEDWFPEGKDKSWWVEPIYTYNKYGEIVYYHGCWLHQKVTFQYPFPASSVVTVYPDLGMIEGIAHIGSGTVCAVPRDVDVTEEFSWSRYTKYPASLDADHKDLNKYMATGIMAAEADIDLMLSPLEYYIPSNVLAWADGFLPLKWKGSEVTTITALTQFMEEYWLNVYLYQQKLDPVAYVRKRQQDTTFVKLGSLKENKLCRTRRDGARKGESAAEDYVAGPLVYPWSVIDGIQSACTEICSGVMMTVTPTKIYRGDVALHKFISIYEDRVIGEGLDIYIGKVLIGKEKIVKVKLQHAGYSMMQLKNFKIEIIADMNFPYWQYVELSLDKTTWSRSITWNKRQLMPVSELYNAEHYEFEFWVKVLCSSTYDDPKPVKVKTTYERTGS